MLNTDKELKLYYSIGEVADMFGVNTSLLRFGKRSFRRSLPRLPVEEYANIVKKMWKQSGSSIIW